MLVLASRAREHQDVFFNMWRLGWIAHALRSAPGALFDGNIFYPEPRTLTLSDAMLVEGLVGAPLLWAGLPPVLVHNLLLLGAIVASASGMFVLARHLTGSRGAAIAAGTIFAFVPYRFEHYMHMELQWTVWMPWAFWALHRATETGRLHYGLLTGTFVSLQMLSSIYYGVFLAVLIAPAGIALLMSVPRDARLSRLRVLSAGALLAVVVCGAYAQPYLVTREAVGGRSQSEIVMFSARPSNYLVATPDNVMYGEMYAARGRPERRLFPGLLAIALALFGVLLRPSWVPLLYLGGLVAAFELSLGLSGYSYRFLYEHVSIFHGFRAMARLGIFVVFFLAVLAAYGLAAASTAWPRARGALAVAALVVLVFEYRVRPLGLIRYPNEAPPLYAWLAGQPPGVVAELPMPVPEALPGIDARYTYLSLFHRQPIVNGYSGFAPKSYLDRIDAVRGFPDDRAIARLRTDNVRYLVVHMRDYDRADRSRIEDVLRHKHGLAEAGRFDDGFGGEAVVFLLR